MAKKNVLKGKNLISSVRSEFETMVDKLSKASNMLRQQKDLNEEEIAALQSENVEINESMNEADKMISNIQQNFLM